HALRACAIATVPNGVMTAPANSPSPDSHSDATIRPLPTTLPTAKEPGIACVIALPAMPGPFVMPIFSAPTEAASETAPPFCGLLE
ncbi:MAG TPA: hypothetical protein VK832_13230, partial [Burkholderiaceae bacterium]|nr:hypothetical protein [Burkholderiaceae bacterium]